MRARFIAVFAVLIATTTFTKAAQISKTKIDAWTLSAHTSNSSGAFSHCAASARYTSGNVLAFSISKTLRWRIGLGNKKWKLTKGAVYPVHYRIDQGATIKAKAVVRTAKMVSVELTKSDALFRAFQTGHVLTIEAAGERFNFSLKSSSKTWPQEPDPSLPSIDNPVTLTWLMRARIEDDVIFEHPKTPITPTTPNTSSLHPCAGLSIPP